MEFIPICYGLMALPAVPVAMIAWLCSHKRVAWYGEDVAVLVVPFAIWMSLMCFGDSSKSFSNLALEPMEMRQ